MKRYDAALISAVIAHTLAWASAIWLAVGATYQGASVAAVTSGSAPSEPIRVTATLIEVNGLSVIPLLLAPVLLTAIAALAAILIRADLVRRGAFILTLAVLLLGFSAIGIASIGLLFLPAVIALVFSGVIGLMESRAQRRSGQSLN
ncbi:MAG: hypothetical protein IIB30_06770 [Chloroflexi bacterium]|nr:hypothetical protein [Chloroflexota bacterium]MCI0846075.1 hypothetical protein [Chloroflexota bacterium]